MNTIAIDPRKVPSVSLSNGNQVPCVGLGTFGSDHISPEKVAETVELAIRNGYRHIDCAAVYQNEKEIGVVLEKLIQEGVVTRDELWITSKVWNDMHDNVQEACRQSLHDLRLEYLDLYLVHWPFPNYHAPGCDGDSRNPQSKPFCAKRFMNTWRQMELLVEKGLVRNIGTSNMTIKKFDATLNHMQIRPVVNEMEIHPCFQQEELFKYLISNNIQPIGFCPIGSPQRPERDKTPDDAIDTEHPIIIEIAKKHNVHPAVICVKWAIQRGQITIPFSTNPRNFLANLEASFAFELNNDEMEIIKTVECNSRLIKGQVFLWEGAQSWEDLWDY
ncbi:aldo/keto reductase [Prolixibacteraceae bacterium JC049]|nr:aldo/keto reductase [Prolixibacteraceae bacterium JC049]